MELDGVVPWIPQVGMVFETEEEAWKFWLHYGGKMGFNVRKDFKNRNKKGGEITSRGYVCANEGLRRPDKRDRPTKIPRAETRTDCPVRMRIQWNKASGKYQVYNFVSEHNHSVKLPKPTNFVPTQTDHDNNTNYLPNKRQRSLAYGEAGILLRYFQQKMLENPFFHHVEQLDANGQIANIFWADAKMIVDYSHFGDVIMFDTTFNTNKECRPFGVFAGFNHFEETVIFGAALLYDESTESFKWLFETFLATHNHKHPKTIFTYQNPAMDNAIAEVMPGTVHGFCTWDLMENTTRHLGFYNKDGEDVFKSLSALMYEYEKETEFEEAFKALKDKVGVETWLDFIYDYKKKWAYCYMKNTFALGMRSVQLCEGINKNLKNFVRSDVRIGEFMKHFDRVIAEKCYNEIESKYNARKNVPRCKMNTPILVQMRERYTPTIFEKFQDEYELFLAAYIKSTVEGQSGNEHTVAVSNLDNHGFRFEKCFKVFGDPTKKTVLCSCGRFERSGYLCCHALKVLDFMNVKLLPEQYILKRLTWEARSGIIEDANGSTFVENPKLESECRHGEHCRKFVQISSKAADVESIFVLVDNALEHLSKQVDEEIKKLFVDGRDASRSVPAQNCISGEKYNLERLSEWMAYK